VSSDSDFTRLAQRLREEGLIVYGFGERKTPDPFVRACDKFVYTEVLRPALAAAPATASAPAKDTAKPSGRKPRGKGASPAGNAPANAPTAGAAPVKPVAAPPPSTLPLGLIRRAIEEASDESGWAALGSVGNYLTKVQPDFDARLYGHRKLSDLLRAATAQFAVEERDRAGGRTAVSGRVR
jgi:hypothetical protein